MADAVTVIILIIVILVALGSAKKKLKGGCCGSGNGVKIKPKDRNKAHYTYKVTAYIDGMSCEHCKNRIESEFNCLSGVMAKVNLKNKYAEIFSKEPMSNAQISDIVTKNGYTFVKCVH